MQISFDKALAESQLEYFPFLEACLDMGLVFDEYYPKIDTIYVDTIKATVDARRWRADNPVQVAVQEQGPQALDLSAGAMRVMLKMKKRIFWGTHHVAVDSLKSVFCKRVKDVDGALAELMARGLVTQHPGSGYNSVSLVPEKTRVIEDYCNAYLATVDKEED